MSKTIISPVRGTRDFYPENWAFQNWLYQKCKETAQLFGFEEYEGPILENLDLYAAKSGEELVQKQAFTLKDQSGKMIALRPEMTPTLARMVAQKAKQLTFPVKWFTFGRRFRYEKPQKGRAREFFQWDVDILGLETPQADAEIIAIAINLFQKLGLTPKEVKIKINDRQLFQNRLLSLEIPEEKIINAFRIADKKDKFPPKEILELAKKEGFTEDQTKAILQILEEKQAFQQSSWLIEIFELIKKYGFSEYIEFDPKIVRGLEYYTKTVFEAHDTSGQFRAICGGGRYDNLIADVGSELKIPGVGFAMGDMVIAEVLKANQKYPTINPNPTKILVTVFSPQLYENSLKISLLLRQKNINTELYPSLITKLDKQIKYADKKKIPFVAILGPEEAAENKVTIKNLSTGQQTTYSLKEFLEKEI